MSPAAGLPGTCSVPAGALRSFLSECIMAMGWGERDAGIVATHLVLSDQSGHPSHGSGMLATYVDSYLAGAISPKNLPRNLVTNRPFLVIDAQFALGHVVLLDALLAGADMAKDDGVAVLNVVRAHHIGRVGHYAEEAARHGLISLFWSNVFGRPPLVAPFGGSEARIGTNPHCIGIPRDGDEPIVLDFATSRIALGKARVAWTNGVEVADGCLLDSKGAATRDASVMFETPSGSLLPFGDHKGAGVGLVAEILSSAFAGGDTIAENRDQNLIANNTFCVLIDPVRLGRNGASTSSRIDSYLSWVKNARRLDPETPIFSPGEPELVSRQRMGDMVWLSQAGLERSREAGRRIGVSARDF